VRCTAQSSSCLQPLVLGTQDLFLLDRLCSRIGPQALPTRREPWPRILWRLLKNDLSLHQLVTTALDAGQPRCEASNEAAVSTNEHTAASNELPPLLRGGLRVMGLGVRHPQGLNPRLFSILLRLWHV
jgi:hypothetical protein